jgi:23S rRNA pseudouridine1911/1915/1917 synthase
MVTWGPGSNDLAAGQASRSRGQHSLRPLTGQVETAHGDRLDDHLAALIATATGSAPSKATIRRLVITGAVRLNGRLVRHPRESVRPGDRLQVFVDLERLPRPHLDLVLTDADVLFEDAWLIAMNKPAGVPTHATVDARRPDLHRATQTLLSRRPGETGQGNSAEPEPPYLGIHHRLDRDTSGVVLFTKDRAINAAIGQLFAERNIDKTYLAVVAAERRPPDRWTVRNHLGRIGRSGRAARYGSVRAGGDLAVTEFRTLVKAGRGTWQIEAHPHTGRTHQVRVHLSEGGTPIVGDDLYGGPPGPRTLLHAGRLDFSHPITAGSVEITSPPPADMTCADQTDKSPARRRPSSGSGR